MAAMNSYAESTANALRRQQYVPTSETLLVYVKTLTSDKILASADAQAKRCIKALKKKGLSTKDIALAFDWHDAPSCKLFSAP
jgi:ABC-type xylose transport system substrate-binding protein